MIESRKDFADRLRAAREKRDLSQTELAEKAGMQPSAIAHFEGNRRKPSFDNILILANALRVTPDYLLGFDGKATAFRNEERLSDKERSLIQNMIDSMIKK
jgi:transcriptional regulator with XRE-family HTH domain